MPRSVFSKLIKTFSYFENFSAYRISELPQLKKLKEQFHSRISTKLMDPSISPKAYWSILKTFLNNKKILSIPPIYHNNNHITDFIEKAQIFKDFYAKQCTLVENTSKLLADSFKRTNDLLSTI